MADFDYGNARLHAMKSRLLSQAELEALAGAGSLPGLIAALTKTVYQTSIEAALTRAAGMHCIEEALRSDLVATVGKIRGFYKEGAGQMVAVFLRIYDIHNLKAILRGLAKNVPAGDIVSILIPVGELHLSTLRELAQLNNPREAIDLLASTGLSSAWPLLSLRAEVPGSETFEMELALDQWYYAAARQTLRAETGMVDPLSSALALEADHTNVLTALRFAQSPQERDRLRERPGTDEIERLFVGLGHIPCPLLVSASRQDTVAAAVEVLSGTAFGPALQRGLESYTRSNRLSDIEREMQRFRLGWMAGQIRKDPLGIGVILGYVALKVNEINNLRWIAHGINLGLPAHAIQAELERAA